MMQRHDGLSLMEPGVQIPRIRPPRDSHRNRAQAVGLRASHNVTIRGIRWTNPPSPECRSFLS